MPLTLQNGHAGKAGNGGKKETARPEVKEEIAQPAED